MRINRLQPFLQKLIYRSEEKLKAIEEKHGMAPQGRKDDYDLDAHKDAIERTAQGWVSAGEQLDEPELIEKGKSVIDELKKL